MYRTEISLIDGAIKTVELTPEEESEHMAMAREHQAINKTIADLIIADPDELAKLKAALGI
jgi:hypothetical protein